MRKYVISFILLSITYWGCQLASPPAGLPQFATSTPTSPARQMVTTNLPLVERMRWSGLIRSLYRPPGVMLVGNRVIIVGDDVGGDQVTVFDAHSGKLVWASEKIRNVRSLHANDTQVFIGTITYVQAFDLDTGKVLWKGAEQSINKKGSLTVYAGQDYLEVYDFNESRLYLLELQTGRTVAEIEHSLILLKHDGIYYSGMCGYGYKTHCLQAVDQISGKYLWSHDFKGLIYLWPTFVDNIMLLNAGGQLFAIETRTGHITWQSTGLSFVTGVAVGGDLAYAMRYDAAIISFDPKTGKQVGLIEMSPNRTIEDDGGYERDYAIAASDRFIAAYYGDSQELIVFERIEK